MAATLVTLIPALYLQDAPAADSGGGTIRIVAGVLSLVLVGIIILRRKRNAKKEGEDEF
jgi:hypothetical protein